MSSIFFVLRIAIAWGIATVIGIGIYSSVLGQRGKNVFMVMVFVAGLLAVINALSHIRRVRLIANRVDATTLSSRHRRQIEIPHPAREAFDVVEAAIRELPRVEAVYPVRDSLQVRARLRRTSFWWMSAKQRAKRGEDDEMRRNEVSATVTPGDHSSSLTLICQPESGAWIDWFLADDGSNLENAEAITRSISRRISEHRGAEQETVRQTETEKELAVAKLSLLHAQVEPHFLYNTLASAQILTRSDPAGADQMLGHLITYLRNSMPRTDDAPSTLGEEIERTRAYLEILKIRMGERLALQIQVPDTLKSVPMPPMMLQTLAENAIKHGLEPEVRGGNIWIYAREAGDKVSITVADDGRGFSAEGGGTGIGLKNVRERLRLAYGDSASFSITSNYPRGVAATITVPHSPAPLGEGPNA
jgi:signal transduction histidine kinase